MSTAIVGYSGFVGSNLIQFYKFDHFYNSKNFHEASGKSFDTMFFCGVPAVKWLANKYPQEDQDILDSIKEILKTVTVKKFILISTIDVYNDVDRECDEDYAIDWYINHPYGSHRYMFEQFVSNRFENHHIIRIPALFGKGLKKNIIYDLLKNNQLQNIPMNSMFQWYDLNWLKTDIDHIVKNDLKLCNLFTEPLETKDILNLFDYNTDSYNNNEKKMVYNTKTKYDKLFDSNVSGYIRDKETVLTNIKTFVNSERINKDRLCVSNICVKHISQFQFACILKLYGIKSVQVAPTMLIGSWDNLNNIDFSIFENNGLKVYSFQSITFGLNDINIFTETSKELMNHLKKVIDKASEKGVKVFVFGCPRNRKVPDGMSVEKAESLFIRFFRELGDHCSSKNIIICLEPNAKEYGCNYLNNIKEVGDITRKIDHSNIRMMVDIGNAIMEKDDFSKMLDYEDIIYNIDIAEPKIKAFIEPNIANKEFKSILTSIRYDKNINLEMILNAENEFHELELLTMSLKKFIEKYAN